MLSPAIRARRRPSPPLTPPSEPTNQTMKKKEEMMASQTLTSLPETAIDDILCRLPIADAVRTCLLSRTWRYRWRSIPDLYLSPVDHRAASQIVALHSGNVRFFRATSRNVDNDDATLNWWLAALSVRGGAKTLKTLCLRDFNCHFHSIAGYFPNLTYLRLCGGDQSLSSGAAAGFEHLQILRLKWVTFSAKLSLLFSACPMLKSAALFKIELKERQGLDIVAKNLRFLDLSEVDGLSGYAITSAKLLQVVAIDILIENDDGGWAASGECRLVKVFGGMPNVKHLDLDFSTVEYLVDGYIPAKLPINFDRLKFISLGLDLGCVSSVKLVLCLLRSCRNLGKLECKEFCYNGEGGVEQDIWEAQEHLGVFDKLKTVILRTMEGAKPELDFLRFVLAKAQALETLMVYFNEDEFVTDKGLVMSQILKLSVISSQARIEFKCQLLGSSVFAIDEIAIWIILLFYLVGSEYDIRRWNQKAGPTSAHFELYVDQACLLVITYRFPFAKEIAHMRENKDSDICEAIV